MLTIIASLSRRCAQFVALTVHLAMVHSIASRIEHYAQLFLYHQLGYRTTICNYRYWSLHAFPSPSHSSVTGGSDGRIHGTHSIIIVYSRLINAVISMDTHHSSWQSLPMTTRTAPSSLHSLSVPLKWFRAIIRSRIAAHARHSFDGVGNSLVIIPIVVDAQSSTLMESWRICYNTALTARIVAKRVHSPLIAALIGRSSLTSSRLFIARSQFIAHSTRSGRFTYTIGYAVIPIHSEKRSGRTSFRCQRCAVRSRAVADLDDTKLGDDSLAAVHDSGIIIVINSVNIRRIGVVSVTFSPRSHSAVTRQSLGSHFTLRPSNSTVSTVYAAMLYCMCTARAMPPRSPQ